MAKGILTAITIVYIALMLIRIFYTGNNTEGLKEVWDYSKVFLGTLFFFVAGFHFNNHQHSKT